MKTILLALFLAVTATAADIQMFFSPNGGCLRVTLQEEIRQAFKLLDLTLLMVRKMQSNLSGVVLPMYYCASWDVFVHKRKLLNIGV